MKKRLKIPLILAAIGIAGGFAGTGTASAQSVSLKTNALYWATTTPNLAAEFALTPRITLEISGGYNPFGTKIGSDNGTETSATTKSSRHWLLQPEVRWWFMRRFAGTFVGLHLHAGGYDIGGVSPLTTLKNNRYDGWMVGAGIGVGHHWLLGDRWGVEAQAGFGFARLEYDKFDNADTGKIDGKRFKNTYFGPTRLNISLVYYLR